MNSEIDEEVFNLVKQLQRLQEKAEALAAYQHELRDQLVSAERKARELHQRITEGRQDVGGQG